MTLNQNPRIYIVKAKRGNCWVEVDGKIKTTSKRFLTYLARRDCQRWIQENHPHNTNTQDADLTWMGKTSR